MADVAVPSAPPLSRVPRVELMRTGEWNISTGLAVFTGGDLASAVAALGCPAVRRPVLKLGHETPMPAPLGSGEPAVGWVDNMATDDDGQLLVGDYEGMPGWLGPVIASAYPDRSIEGEYDYRCQLGHTHPFVVHAVALLGVARPGIGTLSSLQDVATLYGVAAAADPGGGTPVTLTIRASQEAPMPNPRPVEVAAGVSTEDVRRQYYDSAAYSMWICEIQLDPELQLIVEDDNSGGLARVPITIDGAGDITFGAPIPVAVQYIDKPATANASTGRGTLRYASRAESRPGGRPQASDPAHQPPATEPGTTEGGEPVALDFDGLRTRLGLAADADEQAIQEALIARLDNPPAPAGPAALPEGVVTIEASALAELRQGAQAGAEARAQQQRERRDAAVDAAVRAGKFAPSRREHWLKVWDADPDGTAQTLASLSPGLVPVDGLAGVTGSDAQTSDDALYTQLFGKEG